MAGPLFKVRTQLAVAAALRKTGYSILDARRLSQSVDSDLIEFAVATAPAAVGDAVGALGDGSILQKILDFFASPLGKQLIALIVSLLMGL